MNIATSTNPNWETRSIDRVIEWRGVIVNVIGEESWLPGTGAGGLDVHSVVVIEDVKGQPCMVDITELVESFCLDDLKEALGEPKKIKAVATCYRHSCPDRMFLDPWSAPQSSVGPMAGRKVW